MRIATPHRNVAWDAMPSPHMLPLGARRGRAGASIHLYHRAGGSAPRRRPGIAVALVAGSDHDDVFVLIHCRVIRSHPVMPVPPGPATFEGEGRMSSTGCHDTCSADRPTVSTGSVFSSSSHRRAGPYLCAAAFGGAGALGCGGTKRWGARLLRRRSPGSPRTSQRRCRMYARRRLVLFAWPGLAPLYEPADQRRLQRA